MLFQILLLIIPSDSPWELREHEVPSRGISHRQLSCLEDLGRMKKVDIANAVVNDLVFGLEATLSDASGENDGCQS